MSAVTDLNTTLKRRGLGVLGALALILSLLAVPAHAVAPRGTASIVALEAISPLEILAGAAEQAFDVTVNNPLIGSDGGAPSTVDWIEIDPTSDFTINGAEATGDWTPDVRADSGRVIFTGDTLSPGSSVTFTLSTNVARPGFDLALPWQVSASDDGGLTSTAYEPESDGALSPVIRVLQVVDNRFTGPDAILDGDATAGQAATGAVTLANLGSATLTVTPELSGERFDVAPPGDVTLAAGDQVDVDWSGNFQGAGVASVTADATAISDDPFAPEETPHADAPVTARTELIDVLTAVDLEYDSGSLSPQVVVPGSNVSFSLNLDNLGEVALETIDLASSTLEFASYSANLSSPASMEGQSSAQFVFDEATVAETIADGDYTPTVTVNGTDQNGVDVSQTLTLDDVITVDSTIPLIDIEVDLPNPAVRGENPAATSDEAFEVTGTVTDSNENGEQEPCGSCEVTGQLLVFDAAGSQIQSQPVEFDNSGGNLSATIDTTFQQGARSAQVTATAFDLADLEGQGNTQIFEIDIIPPTEDRAVTGGPDGRDFRRIDITLTERVAFPDLLTAASFEVDGNVVTNVTISDSEGIDNNDPGEQGNSFRVGDQITLSLGQDLGEDETPGVRFRASDSIDRPYDRVELDLANFTLTAADGIIPALPVVDEIGGLGELDGQFYTNDSSPDVVVSDVTEGHTLEIYEDLNDNGRIDPGTDRKAAPDHEVMSDSGTATVTLDDLGQTERDLTLLVRARDGAQNPGNTAADVLTLDFTAPEFAAISVDVDNREVQVTLSESLRDGRNAVADWVVEKSKFGRYIALERESVSGDDNTDARTIHISDNEDEWGEGAVDRVTYDFTGTDDRYIDRAGNPLANFQVTN